MRQQNGGVGKKEPFNKVDALTGYQVVVEYAGRRRYPRPGEMYLFVPNGIFGTCTENSRFFGNPKDYAIFNMVAQSSDELRKVFTS